MFAALKALIVWSLVLAGVVFGVLGNVAAPYLSNVTLFFVWAQSLSVVGYVLAGGKIPGATIPEMVVRSLLAWSTVILLAANGWFCTAGVLLAGYLFGTAARAPDLLARIFMKRLRRAFEQGLKQRQERDRKAAAEARAQAEAADQSPYPQSAVNMPPNAI